MTERLIEEDLLTKFSIADVNTPAGKRAHEFLLARAKALAGKYIDFDETPVTFLIADSDEPNGFYAPPPDPEYKPRRDSYETKRHINNPLGTHVICFSRGLIEMVDNLDQLDFVMGHELTHLIMRLHAIKNNSKGEEEIADLHGVDLVYDAGADPKQALIMSGKLNAYAKKVTEEEKKKRKWRDRNKEEGINWSEILDVHMTDENRLSGIEAALTRLSHLIDDRQPTSIDKAALSARYTDPVDEFLKAHNYEGKSPLAQIKLLIDCIDHIAVPMSAPDYYQAQLAALPDPIPRFNYEARDKKEAIEKQIAAGYPNYYAGPVIDKRYQQKIAALADGIVKKVETDRRWKGNPQKPAVINGKDLKIYLRDKAYKQIAEHGYPKADDGNYRAAAGIMYTYFNALLEANSPRPRRDNEGKLVQEGKRSQIEIEMLQAEEGIKAAHTPAEFTQHADSLQKLTYILDEIQIVSHGNHWSTDKLDNLSDLRDPRRWASKEDKKIYDAIQPGALIPWNNLVAITKADEKTTEAVADILTQSGIDDYRVTHNKPYINMGYDQNYLVTEVGHLSEAKIPGYELDFAVHQETVMQAYGYIKSYFENETTMIDQACTAAIEMPVTEFDKHERTSDGFNRHSMAQKQIYDFISLFNALPDTGKESAWDDNDKVTALIPKHYQNAHPIPGSRKPESGHGDTLVYDFSTELFSAANPVFQNHFGESFNAELIAAKEAQQQKMFDTTIALIKKAADLWRDAYPRMEAFKEQEAKLPRTWDVPEGEEREKLEAELAPIRKELEFHRNREDQFSTLILNTLYSIFDVRLYWYNLQRLKPEQKVILANIAVKDEDNVFFPILGAERYECYCDFLKILEDQTDRVITGDYQMTALMQVVAQKYDYKPAKDKEALAAFVETTGNNKYSSDHRSYAWYMHMFDVMQHLEKTPAINVRCLAIAMESIRPESRSSSNPDKIVQARHANYVKLLDESKITDLVARAVAFKDNYEGLSCRELLATADSIIAMRKSIADLSPDESDGYSSSKKKTKPAGTHDKFLKQLDENINNILKKAEAQALQKDNALEKIEDLYHLYRPVNERYSTESKRSAYVEDIDKVEKRKAALSQLSEDPSFWPQDALEHVKAFVFAKNTFLDDKAFEDKLLNNILDKIAVMPAGRKKSDCLHTLLDKNMRGPYPETRDRLFALYTADVAGKLGKDDKSEKYQKRFAVYLKALEGGNEKDWDIGKQHGKHSLLSNTMSATDKYQLLRQLADKVVSQENTSQMAKEACTLKLDSNDMLRTYLYGIGVDYLTTEMDRDAEMANKFIQFLNSKGEQKDCDDISAHIEAKARKRYQGREEAHLEIILKNTKPSNCQIFYENFWAAPLEARAVITARMLKGATKDDKDDSKSRSWEPVFDLVINNLIRPEDQSVDAKYARNIMRSYIKSRSDYERVLIMSAMMVANRNIGNDAGNIGKALKLFLENMGPAEIKLGQAIASHPDTPENIKVELQHLKNAADIPPRWTLYDWIKAENVPEEFWKEKFLGEIMGSASYYTSVALGEEEVLRVLRPEAREKAGKGFRVIGSTVDDLKTQEGKEGLSYGELTSSVQEMIVQAARMSEIETDHDKGQQQYEYAREIYNGVTILSGEQSFPLKVMDWRARGQNWIIMDRAKGPTFNALPETTPVELAYKRQFAKGYVVFELQNILSGRKFDHDKHGAQLSIDPQTNLAGIYDTGAMALRDPKPEEQRMLGNIIHGVLKEALKGNETFSSLSGALSQKIEQLHAGGKDTQYLVEVKKGLLALGDFFNVLTAEDIKSILPAINLSKSTSKDVYQGITERMSMFEKAQLQAFLTMQAVQGNHDIVIQRNVENPQPAVNVLNVAVAPTIKDKAGWLQDTFAKPEDGNKRPESPSFVTAPGGPACTIH